MFVSCHNKLALFNKPVTAFFFFTSQKEERVISFKFVDLDVCLFVFFFNLKLDLDVNTRLRFFNQMTLIL